jgi:hypothetical protein
MRRSPRTRVLTASVAIVAAFALSACGGDDDDDTADTSGSLTVETIETDETVATDGTADTAVTDETVGTDATDGTTGTSGSGEVGSQEDYVAAAQEEIGAQFDDAELADCVGEAMINDDVYAAIETAGLTVEQFSEDGPAGLSVEQDVADQVAADFAACGDLLPQIASEDDELACAEENITNEQVGEFLAYSLFGLEQNDEVRAASDAVDQCISASTTPTT